MLAFRCCLPNKGTNFSANHNKTSLLDTLPLGVVYLTKVQISQQITTALYSGLYFLMVLST